MNTTIALIGAKEPMGTGIAKGLAKQGYRLLLFGHDKRKLNKLVREIKAISPAADVECLSCMVDASWEADIIISAESAQSEKQLAENIRHVATQKIIMVISSVRDVHSAEAVIESSTSEDLLQFLPNSKIVKVFTSRELLDYSSTRGQEKLRDCFIVGNDAQAVQTVIKILGAVGFHPIYAGEPATSEALGNTQL